MTELRETRERIDRIRARDPDTLEHVARDNLQPLLRAARAAGLSVAYGVFIAMGFLVSPAVTALGIGFMGTHMPGMPVTVVLAHLAYGAVLGLLTRRWIRDPEWILGRRSTAD